MDAENAVKFLDYRLLPEASAVYEVWSTVECLYVGKTRNLYKRWGGNGGPGHHMAMACAAEGAETIRWTLTPTDALTLRERETVLRLHPRLNGNKWTPTVVPLDGYVGMTEEGTLRLVRSDFPADAYRLFFLLVKVGCEMGTGMCVKSQAELAGTLNVHPSRISRLLAMLEDAEVVGKVGGRGSRTTMINPVFCFRGRPTEQHVALQAWMKLHPIGIVHRQERKSA